MKFSVDLDRLQHIEQQVAAELMHRRGLHVHWTGKLSTSPLSTATAIMALHQVRLQTKSSDFDTLIKRGIEWLAKHQNADGGWGDTLKSLSNISTSMLAHAVFIATGLGADYPNVVFSATSYIERTGGVRAVVERYGKDKTFSVPILTHCALAGLVDWKEVSSLPFELACLPANFYATIQLPVVSYALPALIAIGQVKHHFRRPWNPFHGWLRDVCIPRSLRILKRIQPGNGGFLEATPLTSFVTMSLAAKGLATHDVTQQGVEFIVNSVLPDGSWPIDTNLATWVSTLSINAISDTLSKSDREVLRDWLLTQQYKELHPFTNASPGGWAWTNLQGGVPDADDTPGAMLALLNMCHYAEDEVVVQPAIEAATVWLLSLQNRDGGWPTFCRGWGTLPFDRSSADITAHCLRSLARCAHLCEPLSNQIEDAIRDGYRFLDKQQRDDGSWLPLWFGNQYADNEINPLYGTAKVLMAYRDANRLDALPAVDGIRWLRSNQNDDGGWGALKGLESSVEETALAVEVLLCEEEASVEVSNGLEWLMDRYESDQLFEPSPIGFYFAKLWYFEELYPVIFAASALRKAVQHGCR